MSWLRKLLPSISSAKKSRVPEGVWLKCDSCNAILYREEVERNLYVCPKCNYHMRINARTRLKIFLDPEHQEELATDIETKDILKFKDSKKYKERIATAQKKAKEKSALIVMKGYVCGLPIICATFDFNFIGGSMGAAVGEKFVQAVQASLERRIPLVCFTASGGARMQEGLISLMQMAKTSAALAKLAEQRIPYITVLTDPTTGGVSASLANLGDIIIAEPGATIGFAGRRVIEQTVRQELPKGFQRSEFLLKHGALDMVVNRKAIRNKVAKIIAKLTQQPLPNAE